MARLYYEHHVKRRLKILLKVASHVDNKQRGAGSSFMQFNNSRMDTREWFNYQDSYVTSSRVHQLKREMGQDAQWRLNQQRKYPGSVMRQYNTIGNT